MTVTRRTLLKGGLLGGAGAVLLPRLAAASGPPALRRQVLQVPLPGSTIDQFVDPLPLLDLAGGPVETVVGTSTTLTMREFLAPVLPSTFTAPTGTYAGTHVWGYTVSGSQQMRGTYIGPVIVAVRGTPTEVTYVNDLADTTATQVRAWVDATDQTLHWADPLGTGHSTEHYSGPIPAVPHLHGGEVPPVLDGGPDSWWTSDGAHRGHAYYSAAGAAPNAAVYRYPNSQEAASLWFHDHVLGATRLNVYAGLAGGYVLTDPSVPLPAGLHPVGLRQGASGPVTFTVPLIIQDRMFDTDGQLFFPNVGDNPEHPYWLPEFEGDTVVVNGKVWPRMAVEPRRYRFLVLNGSNARAYQLFLNDPATGADGPPMWQIGTDGGYLDAPVRIDPTAADGLHALVLLPGERADVIVDFSAHAGRSLVLRNTARHPFPGGTTPGGATVGRILRFDVAPDPVVDASYDPASGIPLRPPMIRLADPAAGALAPGVTADRVRQLTLNELPGSTGAPLEAILNNTRWPGRSADTATFPGGVRPDFAAVTAGGVTEYYSELPHEGTTELWEIVNLTEDAHPIHTHLTQVQVVNRQRFHGTRYGRAYAAAFPGGAFIPAYGPPGDYDAAANPLSGGKDGGNPTIDPYLQGVPRPPAANEAGWKDTVTMFPGQVTRIAVRYAPTDVPVSGPGLHFPFDPDAKAAPADPDGHGYVWHCHIIDHEDNEMMRPLRVQPDPAAPRTYLQGADY